MKGFIRVVSTEGEDMLLNVSKIRTVVQEAPGCAISLDDPLILMRHNQTLKKPNMPGGSTTHDYEYDIHRLHFHESLDQMSALIEEAQR